MYRWVTHAYRATTRYEIRSRRRFHPLAAEAAPQIITIGQDLDDGEFYINF